MQQYFNDYIFQILLVHEYLDDIIVYANSFKEHLQRLDKVLTRLGEHGLKLKPSKCQFLVEKVTYVRHELSSSGVSPNTEI